MVDDDVAREGVAAPQDEVAGTELDESRRVDLGVDIGGLAALHEDGRWRGACCAEVQLHRGRVQTRGDRGQRRIDRRAAVEEQAAGRDGDRITSDVAGDVLISAQRVDAGIVTHAENLGGRDVHGRGTRREGGGGEGAGRGDIGGVGKLPEVEGSGVGLEGLEARAEAHRVVTDVGIGRGINDPYRREAAVDDAGPVGGETAEGDRRRGDEAIELRRIRAGNTEGVAARGIEQQRATGGLGQGADVQRRAAGSGPGQGDLAALGDRDRTDGLDGLQRLRAVEAERTAVEVDAGGVGPAALPSRDLTPLVVDDDDAARTQDVAVRVGAGGVVEEGSRAVVGARVAVELEGTEDFDRARAKRRRATRSRAGIERHGDTLGDQGAAGVIVRITDDEVTGRTGLGTAEPVIALQTRADAGRTGEDIVRTAEDEIRARTAGEAVDIARADAKRRGEVVDIRAEEALEDCAAVTDAGEVERGIPHRASEREADTVGAAEISGVEDGRREVAIEHDGTQRVELAERTQRGTGVEAGVRGEAEAGTRVDAHLARAEGRAGGRGELDHARLDVDATGEAAIGVTRDDQLTEIIQRATAALDEVAGARERTREFHATGRTGAVRINDAEGAEDRRRAGDTEAVVVGARDVEGLLRKIQVTDLEEVARSGGDTVDVERGDAADIERESVAGLAAEDQEAIIGAADVGTELERATVEIDRGLGGRPETTESVRGLGEDGAPPEIRAPGEGVRVRIRRVDDRGGEGQGTVARLGETSGARTGTEGVDDATGEDGGAGTRQLQHAIGGRAAIADESAGIIGSTVKRTGEQRGAIKVERAPEIEIQRRD